jgi:hypothetical protein
VTLDDDSWLPNPDTRWVLDVTALNYAVTPPDLAQGAFTHPDPAVARRPFG